MVPVLGGAVRRGGRAATRTVVGLALVASLGVPAVSCAAPAGSASASPAAPLRASGADGAILPLPRGSTYARQILLALGDQDDPVEPGRTQVVRVGQALLEESGATVVDAEVHDAPFAVPRVAELFQQILDRDPDPSGASHWYGRIRSRDLDVEGVALALATSSEAWRKAGSTNEGYVDWAYEHLLGRPADPSGAAYWTARLDDGDARSILVRGLLRSNQRATTLVNAAYLRYLGRRADEGGRASWVARYRRGTAGELDLVVGLLGSSEARGSGCDPIDPRNCLLPFPNDHFTVPDASTLTGRRVALKPEWLPRNKDGDLPVPVELNRNDGFSPGQAALLKVPGIDLAQTGAAPLTDIGSSLDEDAPIVVIDADTGERHPVWAELDANIPADQQAADQLLYVRPARNYEPGHRYVVALRRLKTSTGATISASHGFRRYRNDIPSDSPAVEARRPHMEQIFDELGEAGIARSDLYLAWDFTVASTENTTGRLLHMRDQALGRLEGGSPAFTVTTVTPNPRPGVVRRVEGTFLVPLYLTGDGSPGNGFRSGSDGLPIPSGTYTASFDCEVPAGAVETPARPVVYGHGLFGSRNEVRSGPQATMVATHGMLYCATDWIGMSGEDIGNALTILNEASTFNTLVDRSQQGILNTVFLGRLLVHEDGFASHAAFQDTGGHSVIDRTELYYDGNSQGGVIGGAFMAVSPDIRAGVLGVAGMNYSTLVERSVDFDPFNSVFRTTYPDAIGRVIGLGLIQMLWDRGETNGYAAHLADDPLPGSGSKRTLIHVALGDHQVAPLTAEIEARTAGIPVHRPAYGPGRSPDVDPAWDLLSIEYPSSGSGLIIWDSGAAVPPVDNVPPRAGEDPHGDPRAAAIAQQQKDAFLRAAGTIIDVCGGAVCTIPSD
jgi:hypothetical protein